MSKFIGKLIENSTARIFRYRQQMQSESPYKEQTRELLRSEQVWKKTLIQQQSLETDYSWAQTLRMYE